MHKEKKEAIQVTKEIMVKFIEMGKVSPASFSQVFPACIKWCCKPWIPSENIVTWKPRKVPSKMLIALYLDRPALYN